MKLSYKKRILKKV